MTATLYTLCKQGTRKSGFVVLFDFGVGAYVRLGSRGKVFVPYEELEKIGVTQLTVGRELWFDLRKDPETRNGTLVAYDVIIPPPKSAKSGTQKMLSQKPATQRARLLKMDSSGNGSVLLVGDVVGRSRINRATAYVNRQVLLDAQFSDDEMIAGLEIEVCLHEADLSWVVSRVFRIV